MKKISNFFREYEPEFNTWKEDDVAKLGIERAIKMIEVTKQFKGNLLITGASHVAEIEQIASNTVETHYLLEPNEKQEIINNVKGYLRRLNENGREKFRKTIVLALKI